MKQTTKHKTALTVSIIILVTSIVFLLIKHSLQIRKTLPITINSESTKTLDTKYIFNESNPTNHISGIPHKVIRGDTIYSLAKKYHVDPQAIADFYGNKFANPETLELIEGSIIIIPNGTPSK
jgi:LysM repeat protein